MIAAICIVQLITIIPSTIFISLFFFMEYFPSMYTLQIINELLIVLNHIANPFLFFFFSACQNITKKRMQDEKYGGHKIKTKFEEERL